MASRFEAGELADCADAARALAHGLVLPGGGSVSVKTRALDAFGSEIDTLFITKHRASLGATTAEELVACRLDDLRRVGANEQQLPQEALLRAAQVDPRQDLPSWDAALHAAVPARFVALGEPPAILALGANSGGERICREALGDGVLFLNGAASRDLASHLVAGLEQHAEEHGAEASAAVIANHGLLSWGDTAAECRERLVTVAARARREIAERFEPVSVVEHRGEEQDEVRRTVGLAMRGALRRATGHGYLAAWRTDARLLRFTRRPDLLVAASQGFFIAQSAGGLGHPLILDDLAGGNADPLGALLDNAIQQHADDGKGRPCVVIVAGLGVLCLAASLTEARQFAEAVEMLAQAIEAGKSLGGYEAGERSTGHRAQQGMGPLDGIVALITGAASGIGLATSRAMMAAGAHVLMTDRDARVLDAVSEWPATRYPGRFSSRVCDVASERQCRDAVAAACDEFGGLDMVVSNAGIAPSGVLHGESGDAALRKSLDINLLGHQRVARAAAEVMIAQGSGGALLFNASRSAFNQGPEFGPYAVPKAALVALMRQYAVDLGHHGIRANAVNADRIRTKMFATHGIPDSARDDMSPSEYFKANLLCRETTADQVAAAFIYLATAEATTGCILTVDGGNPAAFPR